MLESLGYEEAAGREEADLILFNTCSIRESADNRFIGHLGEAKRLKSEDPERVVGVGGCWAQSVKDEVFRRFPFVDVAFGPGQIHRLAEFLNSDSLTAQGYFEFEDFSGHLPTRRERRFQGWLQISQGCNCRCSYCIVPSTRGREVSRAPEELVVEAEALAADGVREVTLLGQNVNSYGRDLPAGSDRLLELLARIDAVEGIERIRYTSPHPEGHAGGRDPRPRGAAGALRAHPPAAPVGLEPVLKRMRRTYDRGRYLDRVALIREHVPDCAITTDIIVGFPGETEADFEQTLEVAEEVGYDGAFTFVFSPRRETEAATIDGQLPHPVKVERMERLVEVVQRRAAERPSASSGARWRCSSRARAAPTRPACAAAPATTRRSTSRAPPSPASWSRSRSSRRPRRPFAASRSCSPGSPEGPGHIRADRGRQDRGRDRPRRAAARAGRGPGGDLLRRAAGLRGSRGSPGSVTTEQHARLEHRLVGFVPVTEPFSVGDYMRHAHAEVDEALAAGRRPIVVGGTGLYLRAAIAELSLVKAPPEAEDSELWSPETRHPTTIFGLDMDRALLYERIDARAEAIVASGAIEAVRRAEAAGPLRGPRAGRLASTSCSAATSS